MSFTVGLSADVVQVEAGAAVPLTIEVANRTDQADRFELSVEGLDPEWTAIPVPAFSMDAHDVHSEKVFLKPPRVSESLAGTYPFVVKIRSLETGDVRSAQAVLEIKPFHHVSVEITPKRGVISAFAKQFTFTVTLMNLGNSEHTMQLFASDPEDECAFEFEPDKVVIGPGHQKDAFLTSSATRRPLFASPRLNSFSATARSANVPSVVGTAQAQLEQRALVSPSAIVFFLALTILIALWVYVTPKPPALEQFSLDKGKLMVGETAMVSWSASNANQVEIKLNGQPVEGVVGVVGSTTVSPVVPGTYTLSAVAIRGENRSERKQLEFTVEHPPIAPDAKILEFKISPTKVNLGEVINVHYKLGDSTVRATLSPPGVPLDIKANDKEIQTQRAGKIEYTLIAYNSAGKDVRQTISVYVTEGPTILEFKADKPTIDLPGETIKLSYQLTNAVRAELDDGSGQPPVQLESPSGGVKEVIVSKTTTFIIKAFDAKGKISTKKITVELKEQEPPPTETLPTTTTTGGGN